jgi:rubrerythrin
VEVEPGPEMDYQDALVLAMKKEKAAFRFYLDLANQTANEEQKSLFLSLAQEEAKHKLRFEIEYDEIVLKEN